MRVAMVKRMLAVGGGFCVCCLASVKAVNERHRVGLQSRTQKEGKLEDDEDVGMS
jgi:hypothetical protein